MKKVNYYDRPTFLGVFCVILLPLFFVGCSKKSSSSDRSDGEVESAPAENIDINTTETKKEKNNPEILDEGELAVVELPVEGNVTSTTDGVNTLAIGVSLLSLTSSKCESGSFVMRSIGGGTKNTVVAKTDFSDAFFSIPKLKSNNEAAIEFSCEDKKTMRCLVKAGDKGVLCNKIADTVISAFEVALGKTIYDPIFKGAKLSRLSSAIVDASKLDSDEVAVFKSTILSCDDEGNETKRKNCYQETIEKSPFVGTFKLMQQIASGWTAEGLVVLLTDIMGLEIEIDPKELYDGLNDMLDEALDVTFFADLRTLLQKAVEAQVANLGTYPFAIRCKVEILGETKFFDPALDSKDKISCDKTQITKLLTAEGISLADITDLLNSRHGGQYSCTNPNAVSNGNKCYVNLGMVATALAKEPDRNDMDGTRRTQNFNFRVSLNDVMPQIMTAIKAARIPMKDDDLDVSRPADLKKLKTTVAANKDYFLGLVGVYRFLNDGELKKVKLSLNDLHEIFAGENFMRSRLTGYGPGTRHARILVDDQERGHFSPLLTYDQKASAFRLLPEFKSTDYTYKALDLSATTAASLFKKSTLPFSETFAMFKDIPDSRQLEDFVFNSSHHEEWNPMGQKYLSVAEFKNSKKPITCNMNNPGVNFSLEKGTTIDCNTDYSKVTCNDDGKCTFPKDYAYPFVLFERGWYGEGVGRLFALGSRSSGREIGRGNGRGILIKEYKSSNPAGACNSTAQKDTVVSFIDEFWCGPDKKCSENITAYCLDMDALGTPARTRFFPGGKYVVSGYDTENGRSWQWEVPQIGVYDSSLGHSKDFAACLHVNSNSFVNFTDATYKSSMVSTDLASAVDSNNDGFVDTHYLAFVNGQIKNCDDAADTGKEKLRLYQYENFADVGSMYVYLLNSDDRTLQYKNSPGAGLDWNDTYLKVSATEIETLLGGGKKITPSSAEAQINSMRFVNPKHDAKFDPYCDDLNNNGACDCYPIESLSADRKTATYSSKKRENPAECGLNDKAAEPTVAQLPYCVDCQGSDQIATFFKNFGGKKGAELKTTVNPTAQNDVQTYISSLPKGLPLDFRQVFSCAYVKTGETLPRQPSLVQWGQFEGNHPGCPGSNGVGTSGPIRLMQFKTMRNAFDTARPNTLIKLINFATKSVGQGRKIKADEKVFSPEEVVAMLVLRLNMKPQNLKILDSTGNKELANFMAQFEPTRDPEDDHMSPFSSIFKAIMYKAKKYSLQDVKLKQKDD